MSQSVYGGQESSHFAYDDALNTSQYAGVQAESPVTPEFSFVNSRVFWAFGLLIALVLAQLAARKERLPAGVKRLPKLPGRHFKERLTSEAMSDAVQACHTSDDPLASRSQERRLRGTSENSTSHMVRSTSGRCLELRMSGLNLTRSLATCWSIGARSMAADMKFPLLSVSRTALSSYP